MKIFGKNRNSPPVTAPAERPPSGFTLLEIIITLMLAAVFATSMYVYFGKTLSDSVAPVTRLRSSASLQRVLENIRADYNGYPKWRRETVYTTSDYVIPTNFNGYYYQCTTAGTSGTTEPVWPENSGATVTDNGVVWTRQNADLQVRWTSNFLTTLSGRIGPEGSDQTANNYGKNPDGVTYTQYRVIRNRFTQFDANGIEQDADPNNYRNILKVTMQNDQGEVLTALFLAG